MSTKETIFYLIIFLVVLAVYLVIANVRRIKKGNSVQEPEKSTLDNEVKSDSQTQAQQETDDSECCGQHEVCEKTTLLNTKIKPEYYDDEELDELKNRPVESYSAEELAKLREVFETLMEKDVAGWLRSLQLREIQLPEDIKEEALLIVGDLRARANEK